MAIQLQRLRKLLAEHKSTLDITPAALDWLSEAGYDPVYGARPLKRVIQRTLQNPLAQDMLSGRVMVGDTVEVSASNEGLTMQAQKG